MWTNTGSFFAALVEDAPDSYRAAWARGARAFEEGDPRGGEVEYFRALRTWPDPTVMQELGERYLAANLLRPADQYLTMSWRADTSRADAAIQAIVARIRMGHFDSAAALGDEALRVFPRATTLLLATAEAREGMHQPARALAYRHRVLFVDPGKWQNEYIVADAEFRIGNCDEARRRLSRALALEPAAQPLVEFQARIAREPCPARP